MEQWTVAQIYPAMLANLNEKQRRLYVASEALRLGYGGITKVSSASGISRVAITKGIQELKDGSTAAPNGRIRKAGI